MAYIEMPSHDIVIDIPDIVIGGTVIKRTATLYNMNYNVAKKQLVLQWVVKHYAVGENDTLGDYLDFIPDWTKETIADNTTMCDVTNGHPIEATVDTGEVAQGIPVMDYDPAINYTGQFDYFFFLADQQQVQVNPLIVLFGQLIQDWTRK